MNLMILAVLSSFLSRYSAKQHSVRLLTLNELPADSTIRATDVHYTGAQGEPVSEEITTSFHSFLLIALAAVPIRE